MFEELAASDALAGRVHAAYVFSGQSQDLHTLCRAEFSCHARLGMKAARLSEPGTNGMPATKLDVSTPEIGHGGAALGESTPQWMSVRHG